ncbi:SAM-dependent methyltransferase [Elizabethkingia anophelis]|uniref:class I SAM-dependent methyltransferase n=1 Tax=Elizabethkingia anophelis TaxID=1117645 RepID=UPI00201272CC|nr:class I SAM-dependent methyltransferase [Elizabethkingia anophelis]MCL1690861.1 class I SAM-dependent methyltransferase [Elizabethkingia anophelis]MDV3572920.1 SAM-dependent methyltransferase [Elizabethkingia anophelis]MDV3598403.1 SAM-dependent methyltransferase [Elizabethkingia anophelis]MDV3605540.1 SAM-dependent methyltransferase [Elizabethkingia anophelis]MDV3638218.1 SAM-dependent methyltransferase [Elizabethkingia anophelis]
MGILKNYVDKRLNYGRNHIKNFTTNIADNSIIVDIGAGFGDDLLTIKSNNPNVQLEAVEAYRPFHEGLKNKGIRVHHVNIERGILPFEDQSVDVILCNQILEHCKEIWWILHEISRVLKVGGLLIVGVPNLASLHNRFLLLFGHQPTAIQNNSAHVRGYTKNDFIKFLNSGFENGYSLKDFGGGNFYPFPPGIAKVLARFFPKMAVGIFFKFYKEKTYKNSFLSYPMNRRLQTNFYVGKS